VLDDPPDGVPQVPGDALQFGEAQASRASSRSVSGFKAEACLARGLLGVEAVASIRGRTEFDVQTHLLIEILHAPPPRHEEPQASEHRQAICRTRAMAPVTR
jgi:hypothetical protein